jgi:SAM-dependent methyltransferase
MECVRCALCGADDSELLFSGPDRMLHKDGLFNVVRCNGCGLIYTNPRPSREKIADYYPEEYSPFATSQNRIIQHAKGLMVRQDIRRMRRLIGGQGKILEIGCGTGEYLAALRDIGEWKVTGVEPSPYASEIAREKYGLHVISGTLFDAAFPPESFDLVLMKYVLEHVHNPKESLVEVHRVLRNDGKFLLWVPNVNSLEARAFGKYWHGFEIPRHLYHFSPKTLDRLLQSASLHLRRIDFSPVPNNWVHSLRYVVEAKRCPGLITRSLNIDNAFWLALFVPLSFTLSLLRQSGRIRVIAEK